MKIQFEIEKTSDTPRYTYTQGVAFDNDGYRLTHHPYDSNTLNGLACLTGNQVTDYIEGKYLPSGDNKKAVLLYNAGRGKVVKQAITLSAKQVKGLAYLGLNPYYVTNSGKLNADICYIT